MQPPQLRAVARIVAAVLGLQSQLPASLLESSPRSDTSRRRAKRPWLHVDSPYADVLKSITALR